MLTKNIIKAALLFLFLAFFTIGCKKSEHSFKAMPGGTSDLSSVNLTVSAAASLMEAMEDIKKLYSIENPGVRIVYNFGSSGMLQQQIEQGAEVDIFLSAASKQMDELQKKNLILNESRIDLLENRVVLITAEDVSTITGFADLKGEKIKKLALGEPKSVPVGQYAEEVLTKLGVLGELKKKIVYAKDTKEVLTWVESSNAEAGIVYATDAAGSSKVKIIVQAPEHYHTPIKYPAAIIKDSKQVKASEAFMEFLQSDKCRQVYEKYGFTFAVN
jgi:molybdate transport system substrate-binding protein